MSQGYPPPHSGQSQRIRRTSNRQYDNQPPAQDYQQYSYPDNEQPQNQDLQYYDHRIPYQSHNKETEKFNAKKSAKKPIIIACISVITIGIITVILMLSGIFNQGNSLTGYDIVSAFVEAGMPLANITVYDENTDPNRLLGRPGGYISKVSFSDTSIEQFDNNNPVGGTIEVYPEASQAKTRYKYTSQFQGTILGSYDYLQGNAVMRLDPALSPAQAKVYETLFMYVVNSQPIPEDFTSTIQMSVAETNSTDFLQTTLDSSPNDSLTPLIRVVDCTLAEDGNLVAVFENIGDIVVPDFEAQCLLKDSDGNVVSTESDGHDAVLSHSQVASIMRTFIESNDFSTISVSIDADKYTNDYQNHADELAISSNTGIDCIIVQITNNASVAIDELEVVVVFYRDGSIIGAREEEETDIMPNEIVTMQFDIPFNSTTYDRIKYDAYKIFINQAHTF